MSYEDIGSYQSQKSQGKVKTSTTVHTDTKTVIDNGFTEKTVTKTITEHYSDGSSSTRKECQTTKEEEITEIGGSAIHRGEGVSQNTQSPSQNSDRRRSSQGQDVQTMHRMSQPGYSIDPGSPRADLKTDDSFLEEALFCHNSHRANHGSPALSLSKELCKVAQSWANHLSQLGAMENSHYGYGENIYWSSGPGHSLRGDVPVDYWYNEIHHFDWSKMDFQKTTGSFTQIVWKETKQLGIAKSFGPKGTYIVAFYVPPGNVLGHFQENVHGAGC